MREALLAATLCAAASAMAGTITRVDPDLGTTTWETRGLGVTFSLTQLLPDQLRAFYLNRGFDVDATERYAGSCVFMAVVRNDDADGPLHFRTRDWSYSDGSGSAPPMSLERWEQVWQDYPLSDSARVAFRWAQFPDEQTYQPGGDWNQGMLSIDRDAGTVFDMTARFTLRDESMALKLEGVTCAGG